MLRLVDELGARSVTDTRKFLKRDRYAVLAAPGHRRQATGMTTNLPEWSGHGVAAAADWFDQSVPWFGEGAPRSPQEPTATVTPETIPTREPFTPAACACGGATRVDLLDLVGSTVHVSCTACGGRESRPYLVEHATG